jgi:RNA polymerase sigma factor (sigma-70 family)
VREPSSTRFTDRNADGRDRPGAGLPGGVAGLFQERHAELVRLAAFVLTDWATAEDVVQDVFARLCTHDVMPRGDAVAYVRAAVLNGCRGVLRRRALIGRFRSAESALPGAGTVGSAEDQMLLSEERRQVLAALAALPLRRREVLVLRYWLGLPEAEIAATLGISPGTVKSTAARGIASLARALREES